MIKLAKVIFIALLFGVGITFSMENTGQVVLRYYFGLETVPIPIFLLMLISILVGILLAGAAFILDVHALKRAVREKEREIASLEQEIKSFREQSRAPAAVATTD